MASSYLPEETYVVCTNQAGNSYRELQADREIRQVSVFYKNKRAFLTKVDKKIDDDFTCKTGWSKGLSATAFIGGAGVALGMAAAAATVPVIGWIVGGAIACYALYVGIKAILNNPKCSGALGNQASQWKLYHAGVRFNKHNAILSCSILVCGEGGVLMPFVSKTAAQNAARAIGWNNKTDIGINFIANGLAGFGLGKGALAVKGFYSAFMFIAGTGSAIVIGKTVINPSAEWVGNKYAESQADDRYREIQEAQGKPPTEDKGLLDHIMDANNPVEDTQNVIENKNKIIENMKANGASKEAIASFENAVSEAERTGTFGKNNPSAQQVLKDIKNGKYGSDIKDIFTNKSGDIRGMNRQGNYDRATQLEKEKISARRWQSLNQAGKGAATIFGILQPFISSIFDKEALIKAKEHQETKEEEDARNGISVISTNY